MSGVQKHISIARTPWAEFTVSSASTNYPAGTVISGDDASPANALKFISVPQAGGSGVIRRVSMHSTAKQARPLRALLYLLNRMPVQAFGSDDRPFNLADQDRKYLLTLVDLKDPTSGFGASGLDWSVQVDIPFQTEPLSRKLFGILVAAAEYDSAASETFRITLGIE